MFASLPSAPYASLRVSVLHAEAQRTQRVCTYGNNGDRNYGEFLALNKMASNREGEIYAFTAQ